MVGYWLVPALVDKKVLLLFKFCDKTVGYWLVLALVAKIFRVFEFCDKTVGYWLAPAFSSFVTKRCVIG